VNKGFIADSQCYCYLVNPVFFIFNAIPVRQGERHGSFACRSGGNNKQSPCTKSYPKNKWLLQAILFQEKKYMKRMVL